MNEDGLSVLDSATVAQVVLCEGGAVVVGTVWEEAGEDGADLLVPRVRLHVATSDTQVAKLVKDYLEKNRSVLSGRLDEE